MLDIKLIRENAELVKKNIKKKYQESKLVLVDRVLELDKQFRNAKSKADELRSRRNLKSKEIGKMMAQGLKEKAEEIKKEVGLIAKEIEELESLEEVNQKELKEIMLKLPNIIDPSVPLGKDDSENVEVERFGEPKVPDFEIPYHAEIMEHLNGIDLDSARKTSGNGFYYLMGDIARLHSAILSYARDFMIDRGFTYCIPPYMIRSDVVTGVMSFAE
ncbi:MAG: serine--tRNA ligase, partial [Erysipelotrichaceae bacterium]|nr:serine--tRNA ligase [Erysipelotrichaceae bacterium]